MSAALALALALQATPETLAELERAFDQACQSRMYGQFDDQCSALEAQVRAYRAELRRRPRAPARTPPPATAAPPRTATPLSSPADGAPATPKG